MIGKWLNENAGVSVAVGLAAIATFLGIGLYQQGVVSTKVDAISEDVEDLRNFTTQGVSTLSAQISNLEQRIDLDQSDLKSILVATNTVARDDVYYAALIDEEVWIFPSEPLDAKLVNRGFELTAVTKFLSGYKVIPYPKQ